jgi:hypothetical protein
VRKVGNEQIHKRSPHLEEKGINQAAASFRAEAHHVSVDALPHYEENHEVTADFLWRYRAVGGTGLKKDVAEQMRQRPRGSPAASGRFLPYKCVPK